MMSRLAALIPISFALCLLSSCETFQNKPLNLESHKVKWQQHDASSESVKALAKRLEKSFPKTKVYNPSDGLTLHEARIIALVYNADLRITRLKSGITKVSAKYAGLWDDPELSFDILKVTESIPDPWIIGSSVSLTIPISGRLSAEKKQAEAAHRVDLYKVAEAEWRVANELKTAWFIWSSEQMQLRQTRDTLNALDAIIESTSKLVAQGELPKTEAALFTIERASQSAELIHLKGEVASSEQKIRSLLGLSPKASLRLIPQINPRVNADNAKKLTENNPTLLRMREEYELTQRTLYTEIRKQYPDLQFGPQVQEDEGQSRIGFLGAIPLPILNSNKGRIAVARAKRELAQAAYETEYQRQTGRLAALQARLRASQAQKNTLRDNLVPMIDRQVNDAQQLVNIGEGGALVLLDSIVRAHEAKVKIINAHLKISEIQNDIQLLMGPKN